ncbi:hypothetical protein H5410_056642 [Solanum commersonii]|uniref:Uncharacterized protein n=1 Tax=Solanum commersonii TaxID=4109 RepID=A0A9J5WMV5_SOLCO|nr:hypothetical protein H5410_056642 [Solanum commersonii]
MEQLTSFLMAKDINWPILAKSGEVSVPQGDGWLDFEEWGEKVIRRAIRRAGSSSLNGSAAKSLSWGCGEKEKEKSRSERKSPEPIVLQNKMETLHIKKRRKRKRKEKKEKESRGIKVQKKLGFQAIHEERIIG